MKFFFAIVAISVLPTIGFSQAVSINTDGSEADATAMLEVKSTNSGVLIPRMTSLQRTNILNPAEGLLVYDTTTDSFWYYDNGATVWTELSGAAGGTCSTLNEAYNCGGMGAGNSITTDYGALTLNTSSGASNNDAMIITTNKGTAPSPGSGITVTNSAHGGAISGEVTNSANQYSAVYGAIGSANNNSTVGAFPAGIAGYYDGSGIGVGVWGHVNA